MDNNILTGKKIVLGVTGCIAAYKSAFLTRELVKKGCEVKVIMTPSALQFITPLTLSALSKNEVVVNMFPPHQENGTGTKTWHIDLAVWADLILIAPCTINTAAKIAHGFADNALTTVVQAARTPVIISPAADVDMYENKISRKNISILEELGYFIVPAEEGELASGLSGKGRFPEIEKITDACELVLSGYKKDFTGRKVLVTAGPTYEDIDPVRYLGNRSSGKMGYAIAKAAYLRGADVTLISGPVSEACYPEIKVINVRTAEEMKNAVSAEIEKHDSLIMSAAVADYKPVNKSGKKIKKEDKLPSVELTATDDILSSLKANGKKIVGFALETDNELANAEIKLKKKNLDMIVLNSLNDKSSGFEYNTNKITIIKRDGNKKEFPLLSKFTAANHILTELNMIV
jgi:phosphopantothenoylcysteine decarboxylase/phosphopantothenate--cysteine ligase